MADESYDPRVAMWSHVPRLGEGSLEYFPTPFSVRTPRKSSVRSCVPAIFQRSTKNTTKPGSEPEPAVGEVPCILYMARQSFHVRIS